MLSKQKIKIFLEELNEELKKQGIQGEMCLWGFLI